MKKNTKNLMMIVVLILLIITFGCGGQGDTISPEIQEDNTFQYPSLSNDCEDLISYSAEAYQDGWEKIFKKENNLSDSQFNVYITITSVSLRPTGNTCGLAVRYTIKKDWLSVNRVDSMTLGVPPSISPDNLFLESDPTKSGRIGISTIKLHDTLSFKNETEALNYFINTYNLKNTGAKIRSQNFQYFWNKEQAEKHGSPFAGEGGEAFISVFGTINSSQNECYKGELSLVSKETIYRDWPCRVSSGKGKSGKNKSELKNLMKYFSNHGMNIDPKLRAF